jgi:hypothetical protein
VGYAMMISPCLLCKRPFGYNPLRVPSIRYEGKKEPICEPCFHAGQKIRKEAGVEPWPDPLPGAYEPCDEGELP